MHESLQEKEYKEALDAFNEKNKEKVQLITRLMEVGIIIRHQKMNTCYKDNKKRLTLFCFMLVKQLVSESEKTRMKKLDELSMSLETAQ